VHFAILQLFVYNPALLGSIRTGKQAHIYLKWFQ